MRDTRLIVSALALMLTAAAATACGDDHNSNSTPDAAMTARPDAAIPVTMPDAAIPDGAVAVPDAHPPDATVVVPDAAATPDAQPACTSPAQLTLAPTAQNSAVFLVPASASAAARYVFTYVTGDAGTQFLQLSVDTPAMIGTALDLSTSCTQGSPYCWILLGNYSIDPATNQVDGDVYFPVTGTVTLTQAGAVGGRFKANLAGVRFDHFIEGANGFVPANDGCSTTLSDTSIDVVVMPVMKPGQKAPAVPVVTPGHPMLRR